MDGHIQQHSQLPGVLDQQRSVYAWSGKQTSGSTQIGCTKIIDDP